MPEEMRSLPAVVWDPNCPHRLMVWTGSPSSSSSSSPSENDDDDDKRQHMNYLWSHTGSSSCNKHEISALMKVIHAHGEFQQRVDRDVSKVQQQSRAFSRSIRHAVRDCLYAWGEELKQNKNDDYDDREKSEREQQEEEHSLENMEMLRATYSAMHLSDVILPLLPNTYTWLAGDEEPFGMPGAASADFIRYLRSNHMESAEAIDEAIPEMLESKQPDQYGDGKLYWQYVEALVIRGQLEGAWSALERNSQFQTAKLFVESADVRSKNNPDLVEAMQIVHDNFLILKEVLLRAPLPGGRNDMYDDSLGVPETANDEELISNEFYLEGLDVNPSDYNFWEMKSHEDNVGDSSLIYTPKAAIQRHRNWQMYIDRKVWNKLPVKKWVPQVDRILSILCGDFSGLEFEFWPEKLCAEILYRQPDCRPRDLSGLTKRAMREFQVDDDPFADVVVRIMAGDAGTAIATHYQLGAASGAALPTTLLAVLYNMFLEADIIPKESSFYKTEFLTEAASAIVSSLASGDSEAGVDLATRLLLPYISQADNSPEVVACLAEILEHYNPTSDASAKNILDQCEKVLTEQKNRRLLEASISVVICQYRFHLQRGRAGVALAWLFRGLEMESLVMDNVEGGSCFNCLSVLCYSISENILQAISTDSKVAEPVAIASKEMKSEVNRADLSSVGELKLRELCPIIVFMQTQAMLENMEMLGDRRVTATCIVTCLEKGANNQDGQTSTFMPLPLQHLLLKIASKTIEGSFDEVDQSGGVSTTSLFDKQETSKLLESVLLSGAMGKNTEDDSNLGRTILRCLAQSIVAENAMKRSFRDARRERVYPSSTIDVASLRSDALSSYHANVQEAMVQRMLDF